MYREAQIRGKWYYPSTHLATPSLHPTWYTRHGMTWLWAHQVLLSCLQCGPVTKIHRHSPTMPLSTLSRVTPEFVVAHQACHGMQFDPWLTVCLVISESSVLLVCYRSFWGHCLVQLLLQSVLQIWCWAGVVWSTIKMIQLGWFKSPLIIVFLFQHCTVSGMVKKLFFYDAIQAMKRVEWHPQW